MIKKSLFIDSDQFHIENKRKAVALVISPNKGSLIMNCFVNNGSFIIGFIHDEIHLGEDSKNAALRLLFNRNFKLGTIKYLGNIFVSDSVFDEIHVYYCVVEAYNIEENTVNISYEDLSNLILNGFIEDSLTKVVFYRYINYIGI